MMYRLRENRCVNTREAKVHYGMSYWIHEGKIGEVGGYCCVQLGCLMIWMRNWEAFWKSLLWICRKIILDSCKVSFISFTWIFFLFFLLILFSNSQKWGCNMMKIEKLIIHWQINEQLLIITELWIIRL